MTPSVPEPYRYIAFLRAINVGGHTVTMDALRRHIEALGYGDVATYIASGNVIFTAPSANAAALEAAIATHLERTLGYAVATFIRTPAEVAAIAAGQPFPAADLARDGATLMVAFLSTVPAGDALARLSPYRTNADDFSVVGREVYWLRQGRTSDSAFSGARLERALALPATLRNVTTVRGLAARYPA
ncbi:MAG: DUF1697 domain-containing protein [Chloroflexi bacterium]|nr:DUF1697 domain-containing protein [Chloroflexota bacterium]